MIRDRFAIAYSLQNYYADNTKGPLEYDVVHQVYWKTYERSYEVFVGRAS